MAFGLAGKPRVAFLDSEQGIGQQRGCIDWIEKGCSTCTARKKRLDWYVAWTGVLIQITTISITQIKSFKTLYAHSIIKVLIGDLRFLTYGGISKLIYVHPSLSYPECTLHRILHAFIISCYLQSG